MGITTRASNPLSSSIDPGLNTTSTSTNSSPLNSTDARIQLVSKNRMSMSVDPTTQTEEIVNSIEITSNPNQFPATAAFNQIFNNNILSENTQALDPNLVKYDRSLRTNSSSELIADKKETAIAENPSSIPKDLEEVDETFSEPSSPLLDIPTIQIRAEELEAKTDQSTQSCLHELVKALGKDVTISTKLDQNKDGLYNTKAFLSKSNPPKIYYKIKATYTLKSGDKEITFARDIYTNATNPEKAILAASAYKEGMKKIAKDDGLFNDTKNQSVFMFSSSKPNSLVYKTLNEHDQEILQPIALKRAKDKEGYEYKGGYESKQAKIIEKKYEKIKVKLDEADQKRLATIDIKNFEKEIKKGEKEFEKIQKEDPHNYSRLEVLAQDLESKMDLLNCLKELPEGDSKLIKFAKEMSPKILDFIENVNNFISQLVKKNNDSDDKSTELKPMTVTVTAVKTEALDSPPPVTSALGGASQ